VSNAILQAFDLLELNGEDYRQPPLGRRKLRLIRLLGNVPPGIELTEHTHVDGAAVFRHACAMGLEGIVSKRLTAPYRSGVSKDWDQGQEPRQPGDEESPRTLRQMEGMADRHRFPALWRIVERAGRLSSRTQWGRTSHGSISSMMPP
jgi:ATP dependent DNA ligase domain